MENKRIKFPVAAVFFLAYLLLSVLSLAFWLIMRRSVVELLNVGSILLFFCCLLAAVILLLKKPQRLPLLAAVPFVLVQGFWLFRQFSVQNVIEFVAYAALAYLVATAVLPAFDGVKQTTGKLFFLPALLLLVGNVYACVEHLIIARTELGDDFLDSDMIFYSLTGLLVGLLPVAAVFFFAHWCFHPYAPARPKPAPTAAPGDTDGSTEAPPVSRDEAYISLGKHIVLCLFTFGIWYLIWVFRTTRFLNKSPGAAQYHPTKKLLLFMFVPFYAIYWFYKHGQRIDAFSKALGLRQSDMATLCLVLGIFLPIVAVILMQDRINAICCAGTEPAETPSLSGGEDHE